MLGRGFPPVALARLALSAQARAVADRATALVSTAPAEASDHASSTAADYVAQATQLLAGAQQLLVRAIIYAREQRVGWPQIGAHLSITKQSAQQKFGPHVTGMGASSRRPVGQQCSRATATGKHRRGSRPGTALSLGKGTAGRAHAGPTRKTANRLAGSLVPAFDRFSDDIDLITRQSRELFAAAAS